MFGNVPKTPDPSTSAKYRDINGSRKLAVYMLLSAKVRTYICKSIAIEMVGVLRYFSKVSGSRVALTLLIKRSLLHGMTHFYHNRGADVSGPVKTSTGYNFPRQIPKQTTSVAFESFSRQGPKGFPKKGYPLSGRFLKISLRNYCIQCPKIGEMRPFHGYPLWSCSNFLSYIWRGSRRPLV